MRVLNSIDGADARELVIQAVSTTPDHGAAARRTPAEIASLYQLDERFAQTVPRAVGIFDDVLTTGAHFKAMKAVLSARFRGVPIVGLFVARRVFANPFDDSAPESPPTA